MHLTIIKSDNVVGLDGEFLTVDCSALPTNFHALQWDGPADGVGGEGEAEWVGKPKPANTAIVDLGDYYAYVERWQAAKARLQTEAAAREAALLAQSVSAAVNTETLTEPPAPNG